MHLEDGLIYLGVVVEVEEEQGQCLVRFGDCTERWSSFNELQLLDVISDDECSTPEHPGPVDSEEESSEIKGVQNIDNNLKKVLSLYWQPAADCECVSQRLRLEAGFLLKEAALGILCPSDGVTLIVEFRNCSKGGFKSEDTGGFLHLQHKYSISLS